MPEILLGAGPELKSYRNLGNASFAKFRFFPGFSTSVLRGNLFLGSDERYPLYIKDKTGDQLHPVEKVQLLPAISAFLINGEFRVGGAIIDYVDVNAVATYAWYPDVWRNFLPFSYVSGHDIFVGLEMSSRFPFFNVNLKTGLQMYKALEANLYAQGLSQSREVKDNFVKQSMDYPYMFVMSVGFSLGGRDSKGNNILRVF